MAVGERIAGGKYRGAQDFRGREGGAEAGEVAGDLLGIAEGSKEAVNADIGDAGKEIGEIEAKDDLFARMSCGTLDAVAAGAKAVGGSVGRDQIKDTVEDAALQGFEEGLRFLDQAESAVLFREEMLVIMRGKGVVGEGREAAQIGKTGELAGGEAKPIGEVVGGGECRDRDAA